MIIKVLTSLAGNDKDGPFTYGKGGIFDAPVERAKDLIKGGLAEEVKPTKTTRESKTVTNKRNKK